MFASVLIANRGEIACRIIRTARALGMRTVAVYSAADRHGRHVRLADTAVAIGGPRAEDSYLNQEAVLMAARREGADCVHPGYGFLAENAAFAEACAAAGIAFVGPPPAAIRAMGRKDEAKALMAKTGIPVLPGYDGADQSMETLSHEAARIGYPVMIKAVAGGGGTGLRRVGSPPELAAALESAGREAAAAFGEARVILEKFLDRPRHIEVQVLADAHGNCVHLFERECSLQRRHQKVIEEAPAPGMPPGLRAAMTEAALRAARAVGYAGAGTVEFLVEGGELSDRSGFYFLEMNTRLQVEHPVTEEVTGRDLVEWQFRVAAGEALGFGREHVRLDGHAIEARVYAEDPDRGFLPSSGKLYLARWPAGEGCRVETGYETGDTVSPHYDAMLAKIVARGSDRAQAVARLREAVGQTAIAGPRTNLAFLHDLLGRPGVIAGKLDTGLIGRDWTPAGSRPSAQAVRKGIETLLEAERRSISEDRRRFSNELHSPWDAADGFSLSSRRRLPLACTVDGALAAAEVVWGAAGPEITLDGAFGADAAVTAGGCCEVVMGPDRVFVLSRLRQTEIALVTAGAGAEAVRGEESGTLRAPMHGRVARLYAGDGDQVAKGAPVAVVEAMKMEHVLHAPFDGVVAAMNVAEGQQVDEGQAIAIVEAGEPE